MCARGGGCRYVLGIERHFTLDYSSQARLMMQCYGMRVVAFYQRWSILEKGEGHWSLGDGSLVVLEEAFV